MSLTQIVIERVRDVVVTCICGPGAPQPPTDDSHQGWNRIIKNFFRRRKIRSTVEKYFSSNVVIV
jgi:hypothetical protein